jgi:hypothetical protein
MKNHAHPIRILIISLLILGAQPLVADTSGGTSAESDAERGALHDYGDAPASYYTAWPVKDADKGGGGGADPARHELPTFIYMGLGGPPDHEVDGQPSQNADGDDLDGNDDEDGVTFDPIVVFPGGTPIPDEDISKGGLAVPFMHVYVNALVDPLTNDTPDGLECYINAWIDWGQDGEFGFEDQVAFGVPAGILGTTDIPIFAPPGGVEYGPTYARVRCSTAAKLPPWGYAPDGEVEDYRVVILPPPWDYGDAPLPYPTVQPDELVPADTEPEGGGGPPIGLPPATHDISGVPVWLGATQGDVDPDGRPSILADGDDTTQIPDDEDGVIFDDLIVPSIILDPSRGDPGGTMHVTTNFGILKSDDGDAQRGFDGCFVSAWIDFGQDGSWLEEGDMILPPTFVSAFESPAAFPVFIPFGTQPGFTYARVRCSLDEKSIFQPYGHSSSGEVEDYQVQLLGDPIIADFGDAPAPYPTAFPYIPAWHSQLGFPVWLGDEGPPDFEPDGQPHPLALGDDLAEIDDEDGVVITLPQVLPFSPPAASSDANKGREDASLEVYVSEGLLLDETPQRGGILESGCYINAWLDFNRNGSWFDPGERIAFNLPAPAGIVSIFGFGMPFDAQIGDTYARVRCSTFPLDSPTGPAPDGEVEDYLVTINDALAPELEINAQANPAFLYAPGGEVQIAVEFSNPGTEAFTLTNIGDTLVGNLNGVGNCSVPRFVPGGGSYQCQYMHNIASGPALNSRNIAGIAEDNAGEISEVGTGLNIPVYPVPSITVTKTASPTAVAPSGGKVTFSLHIVNDNGSISNLLLTGIEDDKFGTVAGTLGDCPPLPFILGELKGADGASYSCSFAEEIAGNDNTVHENTITVNFEDIEATAGQDSDSAQVEISDGIFDDSFEQPIDPP